ncbi:aldehyde dehydrogenase family protein [Verrucomicrobiaceae bacterium R5-34]|uniref:Aldehyde dehydrogenase family protein n=1 Tax=Oceaniferula flava TaxID=2800421 RepID=A0AAE2SAF3_9BACT|nr:aldehyde dehydrogenase family protein [Oceaniferula flavus]MBK1831533.1 aldehyde dehydrogenase family protein [Verrucomicrobiaceae bacterium R5-34]MBK1854228.1 aldehyde dehydrogenase family protein [Oceaniferula flavus]MBM1135534.1 aldehyde dehydrogenase family protein [Oceaniferula flavus]
MKRIEVLKTYKLYIGGKFPRTESGRYYQPEGKGGKKLGNLCQSSRKDFRNAVVAARSALASWAPRDPFNRSQILYRIAEMLEGRSAQFEDELQRQGASPAAARKEVEAAIDRCIYYAGWCDKYQQTFSSVNPVASAHFNFSVYEPMGVIAAIAPEKSSLLGLLGTVLPIIAGGNSCVVLTSESKPLCAITLAEVLATSDLPGGVVNLLTGNRDELLPVISTHMDVNAVVASDLTDAQKFSLREQSTSNLKRVILSKEDPAKSESPYPILATQELKTTWHPIESSIAGGSAY